VRRFLPFLAALACAIPLADGRPVHGQVEARALSYIVTATAPRLNRKLLGPATHRLQGVPSQPIDSFVWDGDGSVPIQGSLRMVVDPVAETGSIVARWTDESGEWLYTQTRFIHPHHLSGLRIGSSASEPPVDLVNHGVVQNVYLHGDTFAGQPVLPTVFTYIATWGPAEVTLNGEPFLNPYGLPGPDEWVAHSMVTEGVRGPDGTVRSVSGEIYNPGLSDRGATDPADLEVHLVFHDERFPFTDNIPPLFDFFYHLVFENVTIQTIQADTPLGLGIGNR
jgi:hypothetical protein